MLGLIRKATLKVQTLLFKIYLNDLSKKHI